MPRTNQTEERNVETTAPEEPLPITRVEIHEQYGSKGILAVADVELGGLCTIRNAKIKEDDYGLTVVMPRTKIPESGEYKDACFFASRSLREQFNQAVLTAYEQTIHMEEEQTSEQESEMEEEQAPEQEPEMEEEGMGGISM